MQTVRLQNEDFSLDREVAALRAPYPNMGGIATFVGCARNFSEGRAVRQIAFDAYDSMALRVMCTLREEAVQQFGLLDACIVHRLGVIEAGGQIVLIATGAQHRAPALKACEWLIDQLKARVPIWKKEISPTGDAWVTPHP